jgi:hypothetical protein
VQCRGERAGELAPLPCRQPGQRLRKLGHAPLELGPQRRAALGQRDRARSAIPGRRGAHRRARAPARHPRYFMENAFNPWNLAAPASGRIPLPLPPDRALQQVAIGDVAAVAALVLERREDFAGRRVEIAGDELSGRRAAAAVTAAAGRHFAFQ